MLDPLRDSTVEPIAGDAVETCRDHRAAKYELISKGIHRMENQYCVLRGVYKRCTKDNLQTVCKLD